MTNTTSADARSEQTPELSVGDRLTVTVDRPAHGGEGIATLPDGRIVFVRGGLPGDVVRVEITKQKKRFIAARIIDVVQSSPLRVGQRCAAAARGAGCCDFGHVDPTQEDALKRDVLVNQLARIGRVPEAEIPTVEIVDLGRSAGWRTRMRLGVDSTGHAGFRVAGAHDVLSIACAQALPGMLDGIVGQGAAKFTPGAEIVVAVDSSGDRHVVESRKAARGRRVEKAERILDGSGICTQSVGDFVYRVPATAFWQAHVDAPEVFSRMVHQWLTESLTARGARNTAKDSLVGWDLYGGVGLFAPVLVDVLRSLADTEPTVVSVEQSEMAAQCGRDALAGVPVEFRTGAVDRLVSTLPAPTAVVSDPPRVGAGAGVVAAIAAARPEVVVHIGCDAATFARDTAAWRESGYQLTRLAIVGAFPGTHHMETLGLFERCASA